MLVDVPQSDLQAAGRLTRGRRHLRRRDQGVDQDVFAEVADRESIEDLGRLRSYERAAPGDRRAAVLEIPDDRLELARGCFPDDRYHAVVRDGRRRDVVDPAGRRRPLPPDRPVGADHPGVEVEVAACAVADRGHNPVGPAGDGELRPIDCLRRLLEEMRPERRVRVRGKGDIIPDRESQAVIVTQRRRHDARRAAGNRDLVDCVPSVRMGHVVGDRRMQLAAVLLARSPEKDSQRPRGGVADRGDREASVVGRSAGRDQVDRDRRAQGAAVAAAMNLLGIQVPDDQLQMPVRVDDRRREPGGAAGRRPAFHDRKTANGSRGPDPGCLDEAHRSPATPVADYGTMHSGRLNVKCRARPRAGARPSRWPPVNEQRGRRPGLQPRPCRQPRWGLTLAVRGGGASRGPAGSDPVGV